MFRTLDELERLITEFEQCSLPRARWNHAAHLTVALWYLSHLSEQEATQQFITGILRYNRVNGIEPTDRGGYNETLTLFWLTIARQFHHEAPAGASLIDLTNDFIECYGDKEKHFLEYYSEELIWSWRARQGWTEPDLKPIDGCLC